MQKSFEGNIIRLNEHSSVSVELVNGSHINLGENSTAKITN